MTSPLRRSLPEGTVIFSFQPERGPTADLEDVPHEYAILSRPAAYSGIIVYGRYELLEQGWVANPSNLRPLILHLLKTAEAAHDARGAALPRLLGLLALAPLNESVLRAEDHFLFSHYDRLAAANNFNGRIECSPTTTTSVTDPTTSR
jgi:hypothetical protein